MKTNEPNENRKLNIFIQVCGLLTIFLGISAILGWIFNIPQLASFDADLIPMALSTAVLFVAYGLLIFFHSRLSSSRLMFRVEVVVSCIGILVALVLFYFSLSGIRWNVEHLGLQMSRTIDGLVVGHMSPVTAFCFLLIGLSFLIMLTKSGPQKLLIVSFISSVLVIIISIIFLLSYIFGTPLLYEGSFIPPALTTSLAFLILGISLLIMSGLKIWSHEELSDALSTRYTYVLALVFIIVFVTTMTAGYSYYKSYEKKFLWEIENQLTSVATLKVNQIIQWRNERLGDANVFYKNAELSGLVKRYIDNPNDADAKKRIQEWIGQVKSAYNYNRICIHNYNGTELISTSNEKIPEPFIFNARSSEVLKSGKIVFEDFYRDENNNNIYLTIYIPILLDNSAKNIIGFLALRIDPEQYLYPLINEWPIPSKTAETLLIRREGNEAVFLNELKFQKNTALNLRRPLTELNLASTQAALGKKQVMTGLDYRGVSVIAYVCPIPNSPWFIVARIDIAEVYAPLRQWFWAIAIFVVVLLTGLGTSIGLIWRGQLSKFHKERYQSTEKIRKLNRVYAVLSEINETIVRIRNPQELFERACDIAIEKGGFQMAWIGMINLQTMKVNVVASKGISEEHLKKLDFNYDDESILRMAGRAIKTGVRVISNDIQNDESIIPLDKDSVMFNSKSSAAFPLKVFGQSWGVFKLYSNEIGFFDEEELKLLDELAMDISFAIEFEKKEAERKFAEESLRENEEKYRLMFANNPQPMFIYDLETLTFLEINNAAIHHYGYTREEFLSMTLKDIRPKEDIDALMKDVERTHLTYNPAGEWRHLKKNGEIINVEINSHSVTFNARKARHVMVKDITKLKQAKETLIASEIRYRRLFESAKDGILILDAETGKIVDVNPFLIDLLGYSKENFIEKEIWEIGFFKDIVANYDKFLELQQQKYVRYEDLPLETVDGRKINVEFVSNVYLVDHQKVIQCNIRDITERKRADDALIESERKFRNVVEEAVEIVFTVDNRGYFTYVNPAGLRSSGYSLDELKKLKYIDLIEPEFKQKVKRNYFKQYLERSSSSSTEYPFRTKSGEIKWYNQNARLIIENDEVKGFYVIARDITERRIAEEALKESEERFRSLYENSTIGLYRTTPDGKIILANPTLVKMLGYSSFEELAAKNLVKDGFEPTYERNLFLNKIEMNGEVQGFESAWTTKDGSVAYISESARAIRDSNGKTLYYDGTVENIAERKLAEETLRVSEERFRHSFDYAAAGICIIGVDEKFQRVNKAFREMIGYEEDELKNFTFSDITHPDDLSIGVAQKKAMLDGETNNVSFEKRYIRKDKRIIWVYVSASLIWDVNHKPQFFIAQIIDITERMHSEEELQKLSRAVEQSPVSITITDHDGKVEYVNPKFTEVTGYSFDEVKGKNMGMLNSGYHPKEFYKKLWDTILSGKDWKGEFYNKKKNGELYWENGIISPIVNENGDITHFIGIQEDITEKKKMIEELITAKDFAVKSNSLKDAFIANISHEIRTPLNGILGMTSLIKETFSPNMTDEEAGYFTAIDGSCERIIRTTDLILNYSQLETGTFTFIPKQLELSTICMNLVSKYNVSAKSKSLSLLFENKVGRTVISADEYSITQVISNLIENAIIYTKRGFVTVKLSQNPQNEILLDVIDTGIGIGGEYLGHLFESFRQEQMGYSRSYEGLGLGLALVKKILDLHKATISVKSKKGEGTTFSINFGKSLQNVEVLTAKQNIITNVEVTSTKIDRLVLIVEDDIINQTIIKKYINKKYNTLVADSYDSVMENLKNNKVDLILMDIALQGSKNGLEITKELKASKEYKHIPIIAATAHAFERDQNATFEAGCDDYLAKPFSRDQLLEKIEKFVNAGNNL